MIVLLKFTLNKHDRVKINMDTQYNTQAEYCWDDLAVLGIHCRYGFPQWVYVMMQVTWPTWEFWHEFQCWIPKLFYIHTSYWTESTTSFLKSPPKKLQKKKKNIKHTFLEISSKFFQFYGWMFYFLSSKYFEIRYREVKSKKKK